MRRRIEEAPEGGQAEEREAPVEEVTPKEEKPSRAPRRRAAAPSEQEAPATAPEETPGEKLKGELDAAENVDDPDFVGAPTKTTAAGAEFERVVSRVFVDEVDFEKAYEEIVGHLRSLEGRTDKAFQKEALTRAPKLHLLACQLRETGKRVLANWDIDNRLALATMRERAYRSLQREKEHGQRNKTISDADVEARMAVIFTQDFATHSRRKGDYEKMVKVLGDIVESVNHYNYGLKALISDS